MFTIEFAQSNGYALKHASQSDLLMYNSRSNQSILFGANNAMYAAIAESNVIFSSNLSLSNITCSNITVSNVISLQGSLSNLTVSNTFATCNIISSNLSSSNWFTSSLTGATFTVSNTLAQTTNASNVNILNNISALTASFSNLTITGNLTVTGTTTGVTGTGGALSGTVDIITSNVTLSSSTRTSIVNYSPVISDLIDFGFHNIENSAPQVSIYCPYDNTIIIYGCAWNGNTVKFYSKTNTSSPAITLVAPNTGYHHNFIAKFSADGIVQWVALMKNTGYYPNLTTNYDLTVDANGNIFVTWYHRIASYFYNYNDHSTYYYGSLPAPVNFTAVGLAKYNSSGVFQWAHALDSTGVDSICSVCTDKNTHHVYFACALDTTNNFVDYFTTAAQNASYSTINDYTNLTANRGCLFKFDTNGTQVFNHARIPGIKNGSPYTLACDSTNSMVYMCGVTNPNSVKNASGGMVYDSVDTNIKVTLSNTFWILKYNSSGVYQWNAQIQSGNSNTNVMPCMPCAKLDTNNNLYIIGSVYDYTVVYHSNGSASTSFTRPNGPATDDSTIDSFVAKYTPLGSNVWVTTFRGDGAQQGLCLDYNPTDNTIMAMTYTTSNLSYINTPTLSNINYSLTYPTMTYNVVMNELDAITGQFIDYSIIGTYLSDTKNLTKGIVYNTTNNSWYACVHHNGTVKLSTATCSNIQTLTPSAYGGYFVNFKKINSGYSVKLLNNLGSSDTGYVKEIFTSSISTPKLYLRTSNDSSTVSYSNLGSNSVARFVWNGTSWV